MAAGDRRQLAFKDTLTGTLSRHPHEWVVMLPSNINSSLGSGLFILNRGFNFFD